LTDGLKARTVRALFWSLIERAALRVAQFLVSVVLARLLLPEQFGLIGMLSLFMAIAQSFLDSGFGSALIQKQNADQLDSCSIFYFNVAIGLLAAGVLCLGAPLIAGFYRQPILTPLTRLLSLNLVVNSFGLIQTTLLIKEIDFKAQMKIGLASTLASGLLGIALAYRGFGVWSLAIQSVSSNLIRTVLLWLLGSWRPSLIFSLRSLRGMFGFGSRLLFAGLINTVFQDIHKVLIGKVFSPADLGYFARASTMEVMVTGTTSETLSRVMFPALSTIQDQQSRLRASYRKSISLAVFLHFPLMLALIALARPLLILLLTDRWAPSIPYFQLLCVAGVLYPLHLLNLDILRVKGRSDLFLRLEVTKKALIVLSILMTYRWGITALLYGGIATSIVAYGLNSRFSGRLVGYSTREQIQDVAPFFLLSLAMALLVHAVGQLVEGHVVVSLAMQCLTGLLFYVVTNHILRTPVLSELVGTLRAMARLKTVS
jgi:O-antigen/teichoic acid export membrane protein